MFEIALFCLNLSFEVEHEGYFAFVVLSQELSHASLLSPLLKWILRIHLWRSQLLFHLLLL